MKINYCLLVFGIVVVLTPNLSQSASISHSRVKRQFTVPKQFQNINVENYLKNPRAVQFQLKCLIYDGPCDAIGKYIKQNMRTWMHTQCKNCEEYQKKQAVKLITFFQENYPKEWNDAVKKYKGNFTEEDVKRFESELGIKVPMEVVVPEGGKKPDLNALAELTRESVALAKTTKEPIVLVPRTTPTTTVTSTTTTEAVEPEPKSRGLDQEGSMDAPAAEQPSGTSSVSDNDEGTTVVATAESS